jgi:hypothetical protein
MAIYTRLIHKKITFLHQTVFLPDEEREISDSSLAQYLNNMSYYITRQILKECTITPLFSQYFFASLKN